MICHGTAQQAEHDRATREALEDAGYRVVAVGFGQPLDQQVTTYQEVLGIMSTSD